MKKRRQWGLKVCHILINKLFILFFYSIQENFKTYEQDWMDKQINRMEATQEKNMKKLILFEEFQTFYIEKYLISFQIHLKDKL